MEIEEIHPQDYRSHDRSGDLEVADESVRFIPGMSDQPKCYERSCAAPEELADFVGKFYQLRFIPPKR